MYLDNYCANDMIISPGHKRSLQPSNSQKIIFPDDKRYSPTFSRIMKCNKSQRRIYKAPLGNPTNTVEFVGSKV